MYLQGIPWTYKKFPERTRNSLNLQVIPLTYNNSLNLQGIPLKCKEYPELTRNSLKLQWIPWTYKEIP